MNTLTIRTNHHWREFVYVWDVPESVIRDEFDWMYRNDGRTFEQFMEDPGDYLDGFFCYRGIWYHISDFMRPYGRDSIFSEWDGYHGDSYFSGVLIRLSDDCETFQVATYFC